MNHLSTSSSPYLLQHATNPVDWYPWCEEAFARARAEQKPIFLSIGYSTCHWCHVMAHESFENEEIAAILNAHFISIKVDREERPDVDRLYMSYVQALTGSGGWPMSVWLTPELKPFFGGTYFPPKNRHGRVGFPSVLLQLAQLWKEDRARLEQEAVRAVRALEGLSKRDAAALCEKKEELLQRAYEEFSHSFDAAWGGFGMAPKFPRPSVLFFLLRYAQTHCDATGAHAREMVLHTLRKMAAGGLHDQLGGGFHRYSVDRIWQVPHFEKMLYDQAQLAMAYLAAAQQLELKGEVEAKKNVEAFFQVVRNILNYVERDMTSKEGGFYSAEDADSDDAAGKKCEGAFYVWSAKEIKNLLTAEENALTKAYYQVVEAGNVPEEYDPHEEMRGKNILMTASSLQLSEMEKHILNEKDSEKILLSARKKLLQARNKRPRPHRDEKILTAWNGLMISAFARAGAVFNSKKYNDIAAAAAVFIRAHLYDASRGELHRSWREGRSMQCGFAEDYAFLIQGLLDLYEATLEATWLQWAKQLQEKMEELFWDDAQGGYFTSAAGDPHLLMRSKEEYDGAEPSANSVAALNQLRFARLLHDPSAAEKAAAIFHASAATLDGMPTAVPQLLVALWYSLTPWSQSAEGKMECENFCCEHIQF